MTVTHDRKGGRRIELFLPFTFEKKRIRSITFGPVRFDHMFKWKAGEIKDMVELMSVLSDQPVALIRQIAFPDADRVLNVFIEMLPPDIRETITAQTTASINDVVSAASEMPPPLPNDMAVPAETPHTAPQSISDDDLDKELDPSKWPFEQKLRTSLDDIAQRPPDISTRPKPKSPIAPPTEPTTPQRDWLDVSSRDEVPGLEVG